MTLPATESMERISALLTLYCESHYDVDLARGGSVTVRIGEHAPAPVHRWIGTGPAFYLTACNPHSQSLPREENEQRIESLRAHLRQRGLPFLEGAGHVPGEAWREPSLLVRGIGDDDVAEIVRAHEQNCVVVVRPRSATVLRIYRPDWQAVIGERPDVEWAQR